ncbi:tRNA (guanosine(37)-N1)-methyltransferase TrmD, partial [Candidatus Uhrbacteria bacterium]|nr:tRNA (guanosine(37)-N1)-methyltransferase TrmD [Candidatus Uhrbacteria bacterium]
DKHKKVDDSPYGGGPGMVMKVGVFERAVGGIAGSGQRAAGSETKQKTRVILTSASGKTFTQKDAKRLAKYGQIIFLCGRYEGVDHRVEEHVADESFSIGNYVLTGGELPALVMIDAIARNVPGVLGDRESLKDESHNEAGEMEYPQYTKPEDYKGWKVPPVLLSGNHAEIEKWRGEKMKGANKKVGE